MDTTIGYVVCTLILMIGSGIGGWYIGSKKVRKEYQEATWDLLKENEVLDEANEKLSQWVKDLQKEIQEKKWVEENSKIYQKIITENTPEVIGEHITEPEDIRGTEDDLTWKQWQMENNIIPDSTLLEGVIMPPSAYQAWREEQQKQCAKDIDRRIPGNHQP